MSNSPLLPQRLASVLPRVVASLLLCLSLVALPQSVSAHGLPDGLVERGVQVIMRPEGMELSYRIGLNDPTLAGELERLQLGEDLDLATIAEDKATPETMQQAWKAYQERLEEIIPGQLTVTIQGEPIQLKWVRTSAGRDHHARLKIYYQADWKNELAGQVYEGKEFTIPFTLKDDSFRDAPGYHRIAFKGIGDIMVTESNTKPIVLRTPRILESELTEEEREEARNIVAKFYLEPEPVESWWQQFAASKYMSHGSVLLLLVGMAWVVMAGISHKKQQEGSSDTSET
ncbi:Hypothetical protein PBC10988_20950 [Planctomycetales bacterium 10988]|nr:Hypothetical protein PBC10988_20950 [Planctomycetales bacterium 10988]